MQPKTLFPEQPIMGTFGRLHLPSVDEDDHQNVAVYLAQAGSEGQRLPLSFRIWTL
jgi:hypothetical protein